MKAIQVERAGGPEVLRPVDVPLPEPGPGEVRVRLAAIGVNFADVLCRRATHRSMRPPPLICGCEGAGIVDACGPDVQRRRAGDRVGVYSPFGGAYAEALVVPQQYAFALPPTMSFEDGAAFTHLALTAHAALHLFGTPAAGSSLLVTAAAGGLGGMLCQLGDALGLTVIAAVGSPVKADLLRSRGRARVVVYDDGRLAAQVLALTAGRGVDLVVETVGGALFAQAEAVLAPLGRIVVAGAAGGSLPRPDVAALLDRSAVCALFNLSVLMAERCWTVDTAWRRMTALFAQQRVVPRIARRFALAEAADAHRLLESRASVDKILLLP